MREASPVSSVDIYRFSVDLSRSDRKNVRRWISLSSCKRGKIPGNMLFLEEKEKIINSLARFIHR